jgi:FkbM family methyltransferase
MPLSTKTKIACARAASAVVRGSRRLLGQPNRAIFRRGGLNWELDLTEGIDFSIYLLGAFEPETVRAYQRLLQPGHAVLDIGANVGAHTLPLAVAVGPEGRVFAFEPTDFAFGKLRRNVELNPSIAPRIELNQALLAATVDVEPPASIASGWPVAGGTDGLHAVHLGRPETLAGARVLTLDGWFASSGVERVHFIKLDVDGHEIDVLKGGRDFLGHCRPLILMEFTPYIFEENGHSFGELLELLYGLGYRPFDVDGARPLPTDEAALRGLIPASGSINVLLRA